MKNISQKYFYEEKLFDGKIPAEACYLPDTTHEFPVYIEEEFLTSSVCDQMVRNFRNKGSSVKSTVSKDFSVRKSEQYNLDGENKRIFDDAFLVTRSKIEEYFNVKLKSSAGAHALGYYPGGQYGVHSDNCDPVLDSSGQLQNFVYSDPKRQISVVLFLTDTVSDVTEDNQASGGFLSFPFLVDENMNKLVVKPFKGLLVSFPSNPVFAHQVHVVESGYRMTIVDWFSADFLSM